MDREAIEHLSSIHKLPRWIEKLLRSYRDKFSKTSMDRNCDNNFRERKIKRLDIQPSYREVLRSCLDYSKIVFQRREKHRYECNQAFYSTKEPNNILSSQKHLSTKKMSSIQIQNTHTHTKQVQPILYFKSKSRQFSEHTLTHVKLGMAKSHCIYACIKNSKEYCVLCVKNIARLHKCTHVMMI